MKVPVWPTLAYCLASATMIFTNKAVLSSYNFPHPIALLAFQSLIAVGLLKVFALLDLVEMDEFRWPTAQRWLPATVLFLLMLFTSTLSLQSLPVALVNVFKNLTNVVVAAGDWYFFDQSVTGGVLAALLCMITGSLLTGHTDTVGTASGYGWMALNCLATASYALYLRHAKKTTKLSEFGMSYYNNVISLMILIPIGILSGEFEAAMSFQSIHDPFFWLNLSLSGVVGACVGLSSFWLVRCTSPTTFSMVGSVNKLPMLVASVFLFHHTITWNGAVSVTFGTLSGIIYSLAKYREQQALTISTKNGGLAM